MGLEVKRNRNKEYQLISGISGEKLHDKDWVTEDEAKSVLIERMFAKFMEDVVKIDMQFPDNYTVNGKVKELNSVKFLNWWGDEHNFQYEGLFARAKSIFKRLKLKCDYEE